MFNLVPQLLPGSIEYLDNHAVVLLEAPSGRTVFQVRRGPAFHASAHALTPAARFCGTSKGGRRGVSDNGAGVHLQLVRLLRSVPDARPGPARPLARRCSFLSRDSHTACSGGDRRGADGTVTFPRASSGLRWVRVLT